MKSSILGTVGNDQKCKIQIVNISGESKPESLKSMLYRGRADGFTLRSSMNFRNFIFRFLANWSSFVSESLPYFSTVSEKSIFIVRNRLFGSFKRTRKSRIFKSSRSLSSIVKSLLANITNSRKYAYFIVNMCMFGSFTTNHDGERAPGGQRLTTTVLAGLEK